MECALYPCFDTVSGKTAREEKVRWVCGSCEKRGAQAKMKTIMEKFFGKTKITCTEFQDSPAKESAAAIGQLKSLDGLGKDFLVLNALDKKESFEIERMHNNTKTSNIGALSCLMRDITIAFSHNSRFRPPPLPEVLLASKGSIVGEQNNNGRNFYAGGSADEFVLPPIPFPEIKGKNVCSGSPSPELDKQLREKMEVKEGDATLLLGFDLE